MERIQYVMHNTKMCIMLKEIKNKTLKPTEKGPVSLFGRRYPDRIQEGGGGGYNKFWGSFGAKTFTCTLS